VAGTVGRNEMSRKEAGTRTPAAQAENGRHGRWWVRGGTQHQACPGSAGPGEVRVWAGASRHYGGGRCGGGGETVVVQ